MRITADTNILVRVVVSDDIAQARIALRILTVSDAVVIPLHCLCEFAWVLDRTYKLPRESIALSIRAITQRANVTTDPRAVDAGLGVLESGGDFADGIIAAAGVSMGGEIFVSFDRRAVDRVGAVGFPARDARDFE